MSTLAERPLDVGAETSSPAERARRVAAVAATHADAVDAEGRFPREAVAAMKAERLLGVQIPAALGGEGLSIREIAEVATVLGAACASSAMIFAMHQIKTASLVTHGEGSAWHRWMMRRVAAEQLLIASSTTEAGIGGDLRNSNCAVVVYGERVSLVKEAIVISYGAEADAILATARRNPEAPSSDQVLVCLMRGDYALERTHDWNTLGMRGTMSEGFWLRAEAAAEQVLPKPFAEIAAQSMLATSHLLWGAVWYGIASDAVSRAQGFVRAAARKNPDQTPPGALRLAEVVALVQAMRAGIVAGLDRYEEAKGSPDGLSSMGFAAAMNVVKVNASTQLLAIINHAMLICGMAGYKNGTPFSLGRQLRDAHSAQIMISNDRILGNTSSLLLVHRHEASLRG